MQGEKKNHQISESQTKKKQLLTLKRIEQVQTTTSNRDWEMIFKSVAILAEVLMILNMNKLPSRKPCSFSKTNRSDICYSLDGIATSIKCQLCSLDFSHLLPYVQ
jgi:hypothetical protein